MSAQLPPKPCRNCGEPFVPAYEAHIVYDGCVDRMLEHVEENGDVIVIPAVTEESCKAERTDGKPRS